MAMRGSRARAERVRESPTVNGRERARIEILRKEREA